MFTNEPYSLPPDWCVTVKGCDDKVKYGTTEVVIVADGLVDISISYHG